MFAVVAPLSFLPATAIAFAAASALLVITLSTRPVRSAVIRGVWRVRWLLLAVFLLYGLSGDWLDAAVRAAVLFVAVSAVQVALHGVAPAELAGGLARVLAPLRRIGVPTDAFAHRLALTLAAVPAVQQRIAAGHGRRWLDRAAALCEWIEADDGTHRARS